MRIQKFNQIENVDRLGKIIFFNFIELQGEDDIVFNIDDIKSTLNSESLLGWFLLNDNGKIIGYIIGELKELQPQLKILVFSAYDENLYALRYLNAGASGYLNKACSEDEMKQALQSMVVSGKYITQNIKDKILIE